MAIAMPTIQDDPLNTVAVVPFDLAPSTGSRAGSASSLAAAASNLISAIAQGSTSARHDVDQHNGIGNDKDESDDGSSLFTYTAVAQTGDASQHAWYATTPYHISNRYYKADVTLKATRSVLNHSARSSSGEDVLSQPYAAYLVVVDRSRSLEHHKALAASLETKVASGFDADISIIAGVSMLSLSHPQMVTALDDGPRSSASARQSQQNEARAKTSDLVALYADFGWEFIAIDDDVESDGAQSVGSDDGENDAGGIERIREALMNHMWNGLVRKDPAAANLNNNTAAQTTRTLDATTHMGFSESANAEHRNDGGDVEADETSQEPASRLHASAPEEGFENLPSLDLATHAETSALDEQLAKLFLDRGSAGGADDLAQLEAFLESQDPSWPAPTATKETNPSPGSAQFDDDFDNFLPFQSAVPPTTSHAAAAATEGDDDWLDNEPSMSEISQMQHQLVGRNAADRLEAGALGMGSASGGNAADQDFAAQLQQLSWHAQRVRNIQDPDQRRKEAALVALAFSMQWSGDDPSEGGMNF